MPCMKIMTNLVYVANVAVAAGSAPQRGGVARWHPESPKLPKTVIKPLSSLSLIIDALSTCKVGLVSTNYDNSNFEYIYKTIQMS